MWPIGLSKRTFFSQHAQYGRYTAPDRTSQMCIPRGHYPNGPLFPGATPKTDLFFQHAQYGMSPLAILYLPIVHGQGTHNKSFWSFNSSLEKWMLAKRSILNFFTSTVIVKTIARAFKSLVRSSNLPTVHHEVGNGPKSLSNPNVNYEVWIVTSRVVNWKGEPF